MLKDLRRCQSSQTLFRKNPSIVDRKMNAGWAQFMADKSHQAMKTSITKNNHNSNGLHYDDNNDY